MHIFVLSIQKPTPQNITDILKYCANKKIYRKKHCYFLLLMNELDSLFFNLWELYQKCPLRNREKNTVSAKKSPQVAKFTKPHTRLVQ